MVNKFRMEGSILSLFVLRSRGDPGVPFYIIEDNGTCGVRKDGGKLQGRGALGRFVGSVL